MLTCCVMRINVVWVDLTNISAECCYLLGMHVWPDKAARQCQQYDRARTSMRKTKRETGNPSCFSNWTTQPCLARGACSYLVKHSHLFKVQPDECEAHATVLQLNVQQELVQTAKLDTQEKW